MIEGMLLKHDAKRWTKASESHEISRARLGERHGTDY
ncbi:hypothetical protein PITCH_A1600003 [uncultured Desulfobacterium sp.]|uniref:Uncharacterized protein n=1 Tax=uncultured Desulfobacterium sp. TaxID=201089 RepID=A0A445MU46_9BACT|nr:hypothetical protein PITCH_A1600003 [uncultured Desulfobacterium sp.]